MGKDIKMVALDMDGTLLNEKGEISDENKKAIRLAKQKGVDVVLSTGRSYSRCSDHAKALELDSYLITVNGSEIYDPSGSLIERNIVDTDSIQWLWQLSQQHKTYFWAISCDNIYRGSMPDEIGQLEWLKFGFDTEDQKVRELILEELRKKGTFEVSNSSPTNIEVNALGINKAKALQKVCELAGIHLNQTMAMGDSLNDIAMITEAGVGVAMGNAQETVKNAADWITSTNQESGVAKALYKWVL
ncbi:Cof-type HAD-IIB family hydrolase [Bacillus massiliglaciei]|uniref:Cof-type HAD-IIB family hydrolase n=1 Tax=Bacillus massiliglaciei TaxID=1816693 RepID=UPI000B00BC0E|nr:Cof-type HAD-IIB family hydrolase [Bacillus massiliglaciei]